MVRRILFAVFSCWLALLPIGAMSADLTPPSQIDEATLERTVERLTILYLLRARFDVLDPDLIAPQLASDVAALREAGENPSAATDLSEALVAEGSYYVTSLRYLISVGGANWPLDKAAASYDADKLAALAEIQHQWLVATADDGDLRSLILAIDQINALTEGYVELPPELDHFAALDQLVSDALVTRQ